MSSSDDDNPNSEATRHWTTDIGTSDHCLNCNAPRSSEYCAECGQRHLAHRLRLGELTKELFSKVTDLDRGLLHTFIELLTRPGSVIRDYVSGRQKPYLNPLTYFFVGTALQMVSLYLSRDFLVDSFRKSLSQRIPLEAENLRKAFGKDVALGIAECYLDAIQQGYAYAALFCFCLPFAFLMTWLHSSRKQSIHFRLGETGVFALFCFAQMLVLTAILTPIMIHIGSMAQILMALGTYIVYPQIVHTGFFESTIWGRIKTAIATMISSSLFFASIIAIFLVSVRLKMAAAEVVAP